MESVSFQSCFEKVPYLRMAKGSAQSIEFCFRGAAGRAQRCVLGTVLALAFPCAPVRKGDIETLRTQVRQAHHLSLLLASSVSALDLGLQHDGQFWMFWKRFEPEALQTPEALYAALDDMLSVMRFLYHRCFKVLLRGSVRKPQTAVFA